MKKIMLFTGIFLLIIFAYFAFHAIAYFSFLRFFTISSPIIKKIFLAIIIFLGGSFFIATLLSHWRDNIFTRDYYFFSGVWVGFLMNLVLFFAIAWIILVIFSWINIAPKEKIIGAIVICAAIIYSAYGIWNAFVPRVTQLNVKINNLPEYWIGRKIVQISDVHLGHIYDSRYMVDVAQKINSLKPDIIVITGDLFDGTDGDLNIFMQSLDELNASNGVYFVTGNHETYLGVENVMEVIQKTKIIPLRDDMRTLNGLQIIGIDYPGRGQSKNIDAIIKNMQEFDPKKPSILLWHTPTETDIAKNAGISLQLSGHTHSGQLFPLGFITSLVYKGYDYGLKQEGTYSIYTSSGLGGWGPPMRTEKTSQIVEITLE